MKREKEALKDAVQKDEASDKSEWMKNHHPPLEFLNLPLNSLVLEDTRNRLWRTAMKEEEGERTRN